jgi:hypothetical protein
MLPPAAHPTPPRARRPGGSDRHGGARLRVIPDSGKQHLHGTEEQSRTEEPGGYFSSLSLSDSVPLYDHSFSGSGIRRTCCRRTCRWQRNSTRNAKARREPSPRAFAFADPDDARCDSNPATCRPPAGANEFAAGKSQSPPSRTRRTGYIRRSKHLRVRNPAITESYQIPSLFVHSPNIVSHRGTEDTEEKSGPLCFSVSSVPPV